MCHKASGLNATLRLLGAFNDVLLGREAQVQRAIPEVFGVGTATG